eukprot:XP_001708911.1 Hypothetical protein GL50803_31984 [Giardia lamblia ATCC 50803]
MSHLRLNLPSTLLGTVGEGGPITPVNLGTESCTEKVGAENVGVCTSFSFSACFLAAICSCIDARF